MGNQKPKYNTGCTKQIWRVTFKDHDKERTQNVAAWNFHEVLDFFTEEAQLKIIEIKKTNEEIKYHY